MQTGTAGVGDIEEGLPTQTIGAASRETSVGTRGITARRTEAFDLPGHPALLAGGLERYITVCNCNRWVYRRL